VLGFFSSTEVIIISFLRGVYLLKIPVLVIQTMACVAEISFGAHKVCNLFVDRTRIKIPPYSANRNDRASN